MKSFILLFLLVSFTLAEELKIYTIVQGRVLKVYVKEGEKVKKGQLLLEIDPSLYSARKTVLLGKRKEIQIKLWKAERDFKRLKELFERDLLAETRLEDQKVKYEAEKAKLEQIEGKLKEIETLISYTKIYAPENGTVRRLLTPEGAYVNGELIPQPVLILSR